ncbi:hypothetical protein [Actinosynnema pretiosum]|uniref:Knr4/Smi1-like domain-containing protein n=1 Tax=Actinosynnema pretiosum TaxID=42197 RepID=A0A290Z8S6_9PSEU|nr:hypothetical protein [Actinosynnema pretiosum]ATE55430.1 hypothetical protein CNX65_20860 [Actinosynnema pretiosum]
MVPVRDAVRRLGEVVGWDGLSHAVTRWDLVEARLGFALPGDYRELLDVFPPGSFRTALGSTLTITPPLLVDGAPDQLWQFQTELRELADWKREHPGDVPHPLLPDPLGLVPWGRGDQTCLLWARRSVDPDSWTVVASNGGLWRRGDEPVVEEFDCGAAEFLLGIVTGDLVSRVLDPVGERRPGGVSAVSGAFAPLDRQLWSRWHHKDETLTSQR